MMLTSLRDLVNPRQLPFNWFFYVPKKDFFLPFHLQGDIQASQWWIHNYWWLHISSELLQSPHMVIVTEVICIKLIIPCNKGHKSVHYQFTGKCFNHMFFYIVQGKRERNLLFSAILCWSPFGHLLNQNISLYYLHVCPSFICLL